MKKLILSLLTLTCIGSAYSQVVCAGISPAAIEGPYEYTVQIACGQWPGEVDDGTWGVWSGGLDFNTPGDHIQAELMLVEDGTPGLNPQGNPISQEGCNALTNNLAGKIAVVYRNTCWFSSKVFYAQQAGAIGIIIVNREPGRIGMLGNTDPINGPLGSACTIPAVMLSDTDGAALISEMQNGPVVMFIGNKATAFSNDVGAVKGEMLVSPFGGAHNKIYDGFTPGIQAYNYGVMDQANVTVNAKIDGPAGNVYDETVGPLNMLSGDTVSIFAGNTIEFTPWQLGVNNYLDGDYTLTYTIDMGIPDDASFDNVLTSEFKIQSDQISLARLDAGNLPIANSYPSNSTSDYQSCMMLQDPIASSIEIEGMYFIPHADTSINDITGSEIFAIVYEWNDPWVDLDDPSFGFQLLNQVAQGISYLTSNDEVDDVTYIPFANPIQLVDNQRYLACIQTALPAVISFGYDDEINYDGNQGIIRQPVSPISIDGTWFAGGWQGSSSPSLALKTFESSFGLDDWSAISVSAFPNPVTNELTIAIDTDGDASVRVLDISGKEAMNTTLTFANGTSKVDMSALDAGVYIFNVTLENGQSAQFNVVRK